jgi:hypothetical protein
MQFIFNTLVIIIAARVFKLTESPVRLVAVTLAWSAYAVYSLARWRKAKEALKELKTAQASITEGLLKFSEAAKQVQASIQRGARRDGPVDLTQISSISERKQ